MPALTAEQYALGFAMSMSAYDLSRDRSRQTALGASDIGFCRQKAAYKMRGVDKSDVSDSFKALMGTGAHIVMADARKAANPGLLIEHEVRAIIELPDGGKVEVLGHADEIDPDEPSVTDYKTVSESVSIRRNGPSQSHRYQRHIYALAALQMGLVHDDENLIVRNVYVDRSGASREPYVSQERFDPTLTAEIATWLSDVLYAVEQGEDASRDVSAPRCEAMGCEYFTTCYGSLPDSHDPVLIEDPVLITAVEQYVEGREMEREGKLLKQGAAAQLAGVNGSTGLWQVRYTEVGEAEVPGYTRAGYSKLDVRRVRR
jgi:hypothetical protein